MLNERSMQRLIGVRKDLVEVILLAAEMAEQRDKKFVVTEGLRHLDRQRQLVAEGKSKTLNSRHLTGHAVDLAVWEDRDLDRVVDVDELSWKFPDYKELADLVKQAAEVLGVSITWGGDWKTFKDGPHFELTKSEG